MKYTLGVVALLVLSGCVHQPGAISAVPPTHNTVCDTLNILYKTDIQTIFRNNCYSCHGDATNNGGLNLEDSTSLKQYLQYGFRGDGIYGSKLYHCILHSPNALPMPPSYIIDTCSLMKIRHWLSLGGPM